MRERKRKYNRHRDDSSDNDLLTAEIPELVKTGFAKRNLSAK